MQNPNTGSSQAERNRINNQAATYWNDITNSLIRNSKRFCDENTANDITSTVYIKWLSFTDDKVNDVIANSPDNNALHYLCGMAKTELLNSNSDTNYQHKKKVSLTSSDSLIEGADCGYKSTVVNATSDDTEYSEIKYTILEEAIESIEDDIAREMYKLNKLDRVSTTVLAERYESSQSSVSRTINNCQDIVTAYANNNLKRINY
tara:strand:+ start:859 stop:1473 length:615 start_codon:yes stop_codon:yes gene_type:complete